MQVSVFSSKSLPEQTYPQVTYVRTMSHFIEPRFQDGETIDSKWVNIQTTQKIEAKIQKYSN